jgi:predicted SAM-dependent methyltransferase
MKIHVGCGKRDFGSGWIHVDSAEFSHIDSNDIYLNKCQDDSADLIYASHLIAYFDRVEIKELLSRWYRVLKPGGILRLATPDFSQMSWLYQTGNISLKDILGPLYGRMRINRELVYHKTVYSFDDIREVLEYAGFKNVKTYSWRETEHAQFDDHSQAYLSPKGDKENGTIISLNVEAVK